jgi:hypothetical protein
VRPLRLALSPASPVSLGLALALVACSSSSSSPPAGNGDTGVGADTGVATPPWMSAAKILVNGHDVANEDCRTGICRHNENTDLVRFKGAIYLVHRTAISQILGPNSALHVYRSTDDGATFTQTAVIPAPIAPLSADDKATAGRDLRDPHFVVVHPAGAAPGDDTLIIKALTRLPVTSPRDSFVDTMAIAVTSKDGATWTPMQVIGPVGYSFWRIKEHAGTYYTAAYEDGDKSVTMFSSTDGLAWTKGAVVYDVAADTPLETELQFMPSGRLLALVRMDGTDDELFANKGRLRTKVCWSTAPYSKFDCPSEITGQRLDGPVSFMVGARLFVIARRHLQPTNKKRNTLFEVTGNLEGGPIDVVALGDTPSAGDTAYAGAVMLDGHRALTTWYSGDVVEDVDWVQGMLGLSDIWQGTIDFDQVTLPTR